MRKWNWRRGQSSTWCALGKAWFISHRLRWASLHSWKLSTSLSGWLRRLQSLTFLSISLMSQFSWVAVSQIQLLETTCFSEASGSQTICWITTSLSCSKLSTTVVHTMRWRCLERRRRKVHLSTVSRKRSWRILFTCHQTCCRTCLISHSSCTSLQTLAASTSTRDAPARPSWLKSLVPLLCETLSSSTSSLSWCVVQI